MASGDQEISEALGRGDSYALQLIWERYASRLLAFGTVILCSHHDAEEALQNVFVKIARKPEQVAAARSIEAYLFAMMRNEALLLARSRGRRERSMDPDELCLVPAPSALPPAADDEAHEVLRFVGELPADQREVVMLKYFGPMTFKMIAQALDVPPNTVASRYRYAMEKLRRRFRKVPS